MDMKYTPKEWPLDTRTYVLPLSNFTRGPEPDEQGQNSGLPYLFALPDNLQIIKNNLCRFLKQKIFCLVKKKLCLRWMNDSSKEKSFLLLKTVSQVDQKLDFFVRVVAEASTLSCQI